MAYRFNPAPGWPAPPEGWSPPQGWQPDPSWPPAPADWQFWVWDEAAAAASATGLAPEPSAPAPTPAESDVPAEPGTLPPQTHEIPEQTTQPEPSGADGLGQAEPPHDPLGSDPSSATSFESSEPQPSGSEPDLGTWQGQPIGEDDPSPAESAPEAFEPSEASSTEREPDPAPVAPDSAPAEEPPVFESPEESVAPADAEFPSADALDSEVAPAAFDEDATQAATEQFHVGETEPPTEVLPQGHQAEPFMAPEPPLPAQPEAPAPDQQWGGFPAQGSEPETSAPEHPSTPEPTAHLPQQAQYQPQYQQEGQQYQQEGQQFATHAASQQDPSQYAAHYQGQQGHPGGFGGPGGQQPPSQFGGPPPDGGKPPKKKHGLLITLIILGFLLFVGLIWALLAFLGFISYGETAEAEAVEPSPVVTEAEPTATEEPSEEPTEEELEDAEEELSDDPFEESDDEGFFDDEFEWDPVDLPGDAKKVKPGEKIDIVATSFGGVELVDFEIGTMAITDIEFGWVPPEDDFFCEQPQEGNELIKINVDVSTEDGLRDHYFTGGEMRTFDKDGQESGKSHFIFSDMCLDDGEALPSQWQRGTKFSGVVLTEITPETTTIGYSDIFGAGMNSDAFRWEIDDFR